MAGSDLTIRPFFWRATRLFPEKELVSRTDGDDHRYTYADVQERVTRLAAALDALGVDPGDRVGTAGWNHFRHFEAYYAAPLMGAQLHTLNPVLPDDHFRHIIDDAADEILLVDPGDAVELVERVWSDLDHEPRAVIVMGETDDGLDLPVDVYAYEDLLAEHDADYDWPALDEDAPAGMCYTSGTTGMPKGIEYTQKMIYSHAMMTMTPAALNIDESDVVMPVVPMFHVNAWEFPYAVTMTGAKQVYPGPTPAPEDLARLIADEDVTLTAGVPTVWINLLEYADDHDVDFSSLERIIVGGSAAPEGVMRRYAEDYDVTVEHAWGMTETMSIGSVSRPKATMDAEGDAAYEIRKKQGLLSPGLEMRVVDDSGAEVPWDGESPGELYVRGPTVTTEYYNRPDANEEDFDGDWLKTGDIVVVDDTGYFEIVDRAKDVIKSGGEWISSIDLENELISHPDIVEAAVIGVTHDRWQERPVACIVQKEGADLTVDDVRDFLGDSYSRIWLPDNVVFIDEVPKTATGKFDKKRLREEYGNVDLPYAPGE